MRRRSEGVILPHLVGEVEEPWPPGWTPKGVIQALEPLVVGARQARLLSVIGARLASVTVVMDAPHDPHNGGAVLRSCDAFGIQELHVVPRTEAFSISTTVTRGSEKWVDLVLHPSPAVAVAGLRERGFELVATHPDGSLLPRDLAHIPKLALVLGNEHDGICDELVRAATRSVRVPMRGFVESLNVSVCAAVLLSAATEGRAGDVPEGDRERLYARGLYRSVVRAHRVLAAVSAR
jgi:tRNA (guanosine-2'-O-)-methyltransferase